jgi:putative colanic acid biosynthesis acetyltransferase WcaF
MPADKVDLSGYTTNGFDRGAGLVKEALWVITSALLFRWFPFAASPLKAVVLRGFGAKVGRGVVIKPNVRIHFPWRLTIGDHTWLGEESWLLNLAPIALGSNVCISQRAFLCTGSHDYGSARFELRIAPITVEDGAWVAAAAWVGPGVRVGSHAVLAAQSVAVRDLDAYAIYQGNPAVWVRRREVPAKPAA